MLASCSTAFGCREEDLPPLRWESERTVIGSRLNGLELCADDLALLDEHVGFVEDMLGVKRQAKVEVYFYDFDELPCSVSPQGCYRRDTDQIHMATWDGVDHELVHAIARDLRFSSLFWDEGVAEALRWTGTLRTETDTLQNAWETSSPELDYMNARHFVRWFVESFGAEDLRRVAEGLSLEEVVGSSFDELVADHELSSPYAYPAWPQYACPYPALSRAADGRWREEINLGCDEKGATGIGGTGGVSTVRTVELEAGRYRLLQRGGMFTALLGCQTSVLSEPLSEMHHGAAFNESEFSRMPSPTYFPSETEHVLEIEEGGLFRVTVAGPPEGRLAATIDLRRE